MPKFLEEKLKKEYGANSKIPYKVMNSIGAMKGNQETAKGAAMERKHERATKPEAHESSHRAVTHSVGHYIERSSKPTKSLRRERH
jgi:hypothetical protein